MGSGNLSVTKKTKSGLPRLPFAQIKREVLGEKYNVSLVFVGSKRSQALNKKYRGKNKPANVLTFPFSKTEGEIFIDTSTAKRDAKDFDMKPAQFIGHLFIHGLLHLKGLKHGKKMEEKEEKLSQKFLS
jgi:rRNA maturation RNase YbeY